MKLKSTAWGVLTVAGTGQFLVLLESTVITVAIPSIGSALGDHGLLSWVLSVYLLAFGALLLPGGAWADRYGQRAIFLAGLAGFATTSALCALAPTIQLLVAARAGQGASAGVVAASALAVVLTRYTGERERAIAMTAWSTLGVIGAVVGSLAAGPLISWLGWPGVFWINVAAVLALLPCTVLVVPRSQSARPSHPIRATPAFASAAGAAIVLAGLSLAEARPLVGVAAAAAGAAAIALVVRQQLRTSRPLLPVSLLRLRKYRLAVASLFLANGIMIAAMYAYSQHLQDGFGLPASTASVAVLPMALASLVIAFTADAFITRLGESLVLRIGSVLLVAGTLTFLLVSITSLTWGWVLLGGVLLGAGLPACFVVLNRRAFSAVDAAESGAASGFTNTLTTLGGASLVALTALGTGLGGHSGSYLVLLTATLALGVATAAQVTTRHHAQKTIESSSAR